MRSPTSNATVFFIIFLLVSPLTSVVATTPHDDDKGDLSFLQQVCSKLGLNEDQCCKLSKAGSFTGYAATAVVVGTVGIPALLASMGFTTTGITAGSWAAWYQSAYGVGTAFSWLQSVSMTGILAATVTKVGVVTAAVKSYFFGNDCKKTSAEDDQCKKKHDEQ